MKKILLLLMASIILVSCGDEEPMYPNNGSSGSYPSGETNSSENSNSSVNNNSSSASNSATNNNSSSTSNSVTNNNSSSTNKPVSKYAKLYFQNMSTVNKYRCYVNGISEAIVNPMSISDALEYYSGTYQIVIEQYDNIYNDYKAVYSDNINLTAGSKKRIDFPILSSLILKSNSPDDYNISINDGMWTSVCLAGESVVLKDVDCTTYKVKFTQRNGYMFYPTEKTVYINLTQEGVVYKFNP